MNHADVATAPTHRTNDARAGSAQPTPAYPAPGQSHTHSRAIFRDCASSPAARSGGSSRGSSSGAALMPECPSKWSAAERRTTLSKDVLHYRARHVGQPEVATVVAVRQFLVVEA